MCGQFALSAKTKDVEKLVPGLKINLSLPDEFRFTPASKVPTILYDGELKAEYARWGLIPSWTKEPTKLSVVFNARMESIAEKPMFRNSFKNRRCLIVADEYFEWKPIKGLKRKAPYSIKMKDGSPFTFAGLWDIWKSPAGENILSTTIITCEPNSAISDIHDRMPVILPEEHRLSWLDTNINDKDKLLNLLNPYSESLMSIEAVVARASGENTLF